MAATPAHVTLVADTETVIPLDQNCSKIRVVVYANPATIFFNTRNLPVPAVAGSQAGQQVIPAALAAVEIDDETAGSTSVVRLRSSGTPTIMVTGW